MSPHSAPLPRRTLLRGAATTAVAVGLARRWSGVADGAPSPRPDNVRVSGDRFDIHVEPHLAANPRNPSNLLAASTVQQATARGLATYTSFDAGATWHSNGLLPSLTPAYDGDVTVAYDQHGHGFVCGIRSATTDLVDSSILLWRTDNQGRTFTDPDVLRTGTVDHTWLATGLSRATAGHLYITWADGPALANGVAFTRSTDHGTTFSPPRFLDPNGRVPMITAGPDGSVHIIYQVFAPTGGWSVLVATSTDHGVTFNLPVLLAQVTPPAQAPTGFVVSPRSTPTLAVGPDAHVYATFPAYDRSTGRSTVPLLTSTDQGRHWRTLATLAASTHTVYLQPMVAVNDHGHIAVTALAADTTNQVQVLLFTAPAGSTDFHRYTISSRPFDAALAPSGYLGDHQGLVAAGGAFHPLWNDTRTGRMQLFTADWRPQG
jgi:hypothetical protein